MDTSKHFFQLHGVDASEKVVLRKRLSRKAMLEFFAKLPATVVVIEACGAAHYWARELSKLGHTVKLIAPQLVKPYVPRNKNDGRDAEGLCEAASRPQMRYVPVKTAEQQAALMLLGIRDQLVARRTQLGNMIRGHAAEFGLIAAKGLDKLVSFLAAIEQDERVPALARELFTMLARQHEQVQLELKTIEAKLLAWHRANALSRRLAQIPGIGPVIAAALVMKAPDPHALPKDHSTGGKTRLGKITRAGDERLRQLLVVGATSVVKQAKAKGRGAGWLIELLKRKTPKLAAVALANKMARIAWKLMTTEETYDSARLNAQADVRVAAV